MQTHRKLSGLMYTLKTQYLIDILTEIKVNVSHKRIFDSLLRDQRLAANAAVSYLANISLCFS